MKRIVGRSSLFFALVYGAYYLYLASCPEYYNEATNNRWYFLRQTLQREQAYARQPILFLGDSRLNANLEYGRIDSCFSLSAGGASPIELYFILRKYVESYPAPRAVVLSQSPRFFRELFAFWGYAVRNDFLETEEQEGVFEQAYNLNDTIIGRWPAARVWLYRLRYFEYYQPDLRASRILFGKKRNDQMTAYMLANNGKRPHALPRQGSTAGNYEMQYHDFAPSPLLDFYFDKILELCRERRIMVYFLNMPMNTYSFRRLSPRFLAEYETYLSEKQSLYPEFRFQAQLYSWPDSLFGDASHLHAGGAELFTDAFLNTYYPSIKENASLRLRSLRLGDAQRRTNQPSAKGHQR